jgi:hypothetical protein
MTAEQKQSVQEIRSTHPAAFRSGQWAKVVAIVPSSERECYLVEFPDGATDFWAVNDPDAGYEFR